MHSRQRWAEPQAMRYAHNVPRFLFQHLFHSELSDVKESQEVGRDQSIEVLGSKVREGLDVVDSGAIHQNIDGSEVFDRCFDSFAAVSCLPISPSTRTRLGDAVNDSLT